MSEVKRAVTHNGQFHPDDVFSAVVIEKIFPGVEIVRTRDPKVIDSADLVFDVGRVYDPDEQRFDHHQPAAPLRENEIPYSAFGLLWLKYGEEYCGDAEVARAIDCRLVQIIDANDNGYTVSQPVDDDIVPFDICDLISSFNPLFGSDEDYDRQYKMAVGIAKTILERLVLVEASNLTKKRYFDEQLKQSSDSRFVILDKNGSYKDLAQKYNELLYVVSPDTANDTWGLMAVNDASDPFVLKKPLPEEWAGLQGEDLASVTGVSDAQFCHLKRFYAVAKSKEGILRLLDIALSHEDYI